MARNAAIKKQPAKKKPPRVKATKPSRVYAYKTKRPFEGLDTFNDQVGKKHKYHNKLVEIELDRRRRVDELIAANSAVVRDLDAQIAAKEAAIEARCKEVSKRNQKARSRTGTADDRAALRSLRNERKTLGRERKAARTEMFKTLRSSLAVIDDEAYTAAKDFRRYQSGLYWGNYLFVDGANKQIRKGAPPRFKRWHDTKRHCISVQIQNGMTWEEITACTDSRIRVQEIPKSEWPTETTVSGLAPRDKLRLINFQEQLKRISKDGVDKNDPTRQWIVRQIRLLERKAEPRTIKLPMSAVDHVQQRKARAVLWIRACSDDNKDPIWVKANMHLFRLPPMDGRIKWIHLFREFVGTHENWEVQFTIERDSWERPGQATEGLAGVDVNWRLTKDGLRVAYVVDDNGKPHTLTLPHSILKDWGRCSEIQSARDLNYTMAHQALLDFFAERKRSGAPELSEEFAKIFVNLAFWKSLARLDKAILDWSEHRFDGDEAIFTQMSIWRSNERSQRDAQHSLKQAVIRRRTDYYRRFAAKLAYNYHTVAVEDTNWRELKAVPGPEAESGNHGPRKYANVGAAGDLTRTISQAVARTLYMPAANTTRTCHHCGQIDEFDRVELFHTCSGCGQVWDIDENSAYNLRDSTTALTEDQKVYYTVPKSIRERSKKEKEPNPEQHALENPAAEHDD